MQNRDNDNDYIEGEFLLDYISFGLRVNLRAIEPLIESAQGTVDESLRKSLCISGTQLLFSSYEDFALLLHAIRLKAKRNQHFHISLEADKSNKLGRATVPRLFKKYTSAREMLDSFGFSSISYETYRVGSPNFSREQYEARFLDLANSVKQIGEYQESYKKIKNRLKHGKAIFEKTEGSNPNHIIFFDWEETEGINQLNANHMDVSLEQFKVALIHIKKMYVHSLELLWLFMIQYHPLMAEEFEKLYLSLIAEIE